MGTQLFIVGSTAYQIWRLTRTGELPFGIVPACLANPDWATSHIEEVERLLARLPWGRADSRMLTESVVHVAVPRSEMRRRSRFIVAHVMNPEAFIESFECIAPNVFVLKPQECIRSMVRGMEVGRSLITIMEFCGTYTLDPLSNEYVYGVDPILDWQIATRLAGKRDSSIAFGWVAGGSASVMESCVYALSTLPYRYGGYNLGKPLLNVPIDRYGNVVDRPFTGCMRPDVYYPEAHLALEYNSQEFHAGPEKLARDMRRIEELERRGIRVITLTAGKVFDADRFHEVAVSIARCTGKRLRLPEGFLQVRNELRTAILKQRR